MNPLDLHLLSSLCIVTFNTKSRKDLGINMRLKNLFASIVKSLCLLHRKIEFRVHAIRSVLYIHSLKQKITYIFFTLHLSLLAHIWYMNN